MSDQDKSLTLIEAQAVDWFLRVQGDNVRDEDVAALTVWLEKSPAHVAAFDRAEHLWEKLGALPAAAAAGAAPNAVATSPVTTSEVINIEDFRRSREKDAAPSAPVRSWWQTPWAGRIAAALIVAILIPLYLFSHSVLPRSYQTAKGETHTITLADGTRLRLNSDTRIIVRDGEKERGVTLERGEIALNVRHDASRPFRLKAGKINMVDVGTEFNVLRHDGRVTVTVRDGAVALSDTAANKPGGVLRAGDQAIVSEETGKLRWRKVDPAMAFAWEGGHVIYADRPLSEVASDLNRYFAKPIVVDGAAGQIKVSAVLSLDTEELVVKRLQAYAPITATFSSRAIHLRLRPSVQPSS